MDSFVQRFLSALLIFTVLSLNIGCCSEFSELSARSENSSQEKYSVDTLDEPQASLSAEKNTFPDTDCQGTGGCLQCRTGCCHLLIPTLSNLVSNSTNSDGFEETRSAIYLSRILSGPEEPPKA